MKHNEQKSTIWRCAALVAVLLAMGNGAVQAQWDQNVACPGWNNPTSFEFGTTPVGQYSTDNATNENNNGFHGWAGRTGVKSNQAPNALTGSTSVQWGAAIPASQMASKTMQANYDCANVPEMTIGGVTVSSTEMRARAFTIMSSTTQYTGFPANVDPNTVSSAAQAANGLRYVPTQFNLVDTTDAAGGTDFSKSIRIGHACGRSSGADNATALYYYMMVTPQNAMMYVYYAAVFENPTSHSQGEVPLIIIRVMKQNASGQWIQASPTGYYPSGSNQCDTLSYMEIAYTSQIQASPGYNTNQPGVWHSYNSFGYTGFWKDWTKVAINLSNLMYSRVRIEVMASTCSMTQHYGYAYIAGECRPMAISSSGCPAGMSTEVTTLNAPRGMQNYKWYASDHGAAGNDMAYFLDENIAESARYFRWRALTGDQTEAQGGNQYAVQASDFAVHYRPNEYHNPNLILERDSMAMIQAFRCEMTSALVPTKPFKSNLYVSVQNTKPSMNVRIHPFCGGDVELKNESYVAGNDDLIDLGSTVWSFYDNQGCFGDPDTVVNGGELVTLNFAGDTQRGVKVRSNIHTDQVDLGGRECYSEKVYPITPLPNPVGGFTVNPNNRILCASDPTATLIDTTANSTYREWRFRGADDDSTTTISDTVMGDGISYQHTFPVHTDGVEPIEMMVRNGLSYQDYEDQSRTIWCENVIRDTINVFTNPQLTTHGDSIVCRGQTTKVWVTSDIENCTYQWSTSPTTVTGVSGASDTLKVEPYADTVTYYVHVTSPPPQNCKAVDSARVFLVTPKLTKLPADGQVCPGDPVTLAASNAHHYSWSASPSDTSLLSQDTLATVVVTPQENTTYTLVGYGSNDCAASPLTTDVTVHPLPVSTVQLDPGAIDSEDPTITLRDVSPYAVSSMWTFAGGELVPGSEVTHTFEESTGADSVFVTLTNMNDLGCTTVYNFGIPVNLYTAWFPNVFTPGSEDANSRFRLFTINAYEHFHIYVYNRGGQLVFDSADPTFVWDGTMPDGSLCPQGTYMYICRFRKPGAYTLMTIRGSVSLVR